MPRSMRHRTPRRLVNLDPEMDSRIGDAWSDAGTGGITLLPVSVELRSLFDCFEEEIWRKGERIRARGRESWDLYRNLGRERQRRIRNECAANLFFLSLSSLSLSLPLFCPILFDVLRGRGRGRSCKNGSCIIFIFIFLLLIFGKVANTKSVVSYF